VAAAVSDDYAASTSTTGRLTAGGSVTGQIETVGDKDWFAVNLTAGQVYTFGLNAAVANGLSDPYLKLYNGSGTYLTYNDDAPTSLNSLLTYTPTSTGNYYLEARAYSSGVGAYTLSASGTAVTDTTDPTVISFSPADEANTVAVGSNVVLTFSEGIQRGTGTINLKTAAGTLVESFDAATSGRLSLSGSTLTLDPTASLANGTGYRVEFGAGTVHDLAMNDYVGTTNYNFTTVAAAVSDDYAASTSTTGRLTAGGSVTGQIETVGDKDWFAVNLTAGQVYTFGLNAAVANGLSDPYLVLYNNTSNQLAYNDDAPDSTNSLLSFTATSTGTYYLEARAYASGVGAYSLSAASTPAPSTGGSGFSITVNYTGDASYQTYFTQAAQRWAEIITGDLPDVNSIRGPIDDLLIDASVGAIDGAGGILGQAQITGVRSGGLPYLGVMKFDVADIADMVSDGTFGSVVLHEMGHLLGLSKTMWQWQGLVSGSNYTGANAVSAYISLASGVQTSVPIETGGGTGTAGSHWSESVFDEELMTGYVESSLPMPLSIITVGALQDLGYQVNYAAADYYFI